jgi:hypothetical protein
MSEAPSPTYPADRPTDRTRFDLLLADYQAARDDERSFATVQAASIGLAISLLGLIAAGITQTCTIQQRPGCYALPPFFLAALPLGPAAVGSFLMIFGAASTVRNYYLRALEQELRRYVPGSFDGLASVGPASLVALTIELTSLRRGRLGYRLLTNFIFLTVVVIFGGITLYIGLRVPGNVQVFMAVVYIPFAVILFAEIYAVTVGGRRLFVDAVERVSVGPGGLPRVTQPTRPPRQRRLASYLLIPRPEDWPKWLIAPGAYLLVAWSRGSLGDPRNFVVLWLVLEFLIYESRYQWNDIRGMAGDQAHPERRARARLPIGRTPAKTRRNVAASIIVAVVRLLLAGGVGVMTGLSRPILALVLLVFAIALVYEWLRSVEVDRAAIVRGVPAAAVGIWLIVGLGYGIRAGVAMASAGVRLTAPIGIVGLLCLAMFGIMFVLLTWALESASLSRVAGRTLHPTEELFERPHIGALVKYTDRTVSDAVGDPRLPDGRRANVLEGRGRIDAPWNLAGVAALALGTTFGARLAAMPDRYVLWSTAIALGGAVVLTLMSSSLMRLTVLIAGAGALGYVAYTTPTRAPALVVIPWLVIAVWYVAFRASTYHALKHAVQRTVLAVVTFAARSLRSLIGNATWSYGRYDEALKALAHRLTDSDSSGPETRSSSEDQR